MAKEKKELKINGSPKTVSLDTTTLFGTRHVGNESPIDIYIKKNKYLMSKIGELQRGGIITESDGELFNLFLLGFVSNAESYFRYIIRRVLLMDKWSMEKSFEQQLTYAAAMHHKVELFPDALLEQSTFISLDNIKKTTNDFLNISINPQQHRELASCISAFEQACQFRHCIVHRAGLLGAKNATKLGIEQHKRFLEEPISLNLSSLQNLNVICLNCVKAYNDFIFNALIYRYIENNGSSIEWNYNIDRKWFNKYFYLFVSEELKADRTLTGSSAYTCKKAYDELRANNNRRR